MSNKSALTSGSPETIACKASGKKLYDILKKKGIELTGVGVTLAANKQDAAIQIMLLKKKDSLQVPIVFENYEVKTVVTGVIKPL